MATKHYSKGDLTIKWQPDVCIHSTLCAQGLSAVFDPNKRPWVNVDNATAQEIKDQVNKCPSGALSIVQSSNQEVNDMIKIETRENGPLLVHGEVVVTHNDQSITRETKMTAFCRCGASKNKPFCDGAHSKIDFKG